MALIKDTSERQGLVKHNWSIHLISISMNYDDCKHVHSQMVHIVVRFISIDIYIDIYIYRDDLR